MARGRGRYKVSFDPRPYSQTTLIFPHHLQRRLPRSPDSVSNDDQLNRHSQQASMLDWCPVCENLIPPERHTVTLPPLAAAATIDTTVDVSGSTDQSTQQVTKTVAKPGKQQTGRRPGLNRQNSRAATARKATAANVTAVKEQPEAPQAAPEVLEKTTAPVRRRVVISQGPTPLYCSEECRRKDYLSSTLSHPNLQAWNASQGYTELPFASGQLYGNTAGPDERRYSSPRVQTHSASPPSPFLMDQTARTVHDASKGLPYVDPRRQPALQRHPNNSASSASATATTTTASSESIVSMTNPHPDPPAHSKPPGHLRMTALGRPTDDEPRPQSILPGSAPAATDLDSHPSHAILSTANLPRNLMDKWSNLPAARQELAPPRDRRSSRDQVSTYDLYKTTYPLAHESKRPQPPYSSSRQNSNGERRRSGSRRTESRRASEIPMSGWGIGGEDITPTQSLLITRVPLRKDDSFDQLASITRKSRTAPPSSAASDSGSSDRSTSVKSHTHSEKRRKSSRGSKRA